jgi:predicted kinase
MPFPAMYPRCCCNAAAGTRDQCLTALECGIRNGLSCVIDRCHVDADQRAPFIQLATSLRVPVHCVVLDQPLKLCIQRAQARTDHPSGVMGPSAGGIVSRFHGSLTAGKSCLEM